MSHQNSKDARVAAMRCALALLMQAMDMIDGFGGAPDAAAHIDLAIAALRDVLGETPAGPS